jgi:cell division protein FtsL
MDTSMGNVSQIVQKVRQAHWRVQRQWIGLFLLGLVAVAMVAGIYLNITVRANLVGREIQSLQSNLNDGRQANSDLESKMAGLTAVETMQKRAEALGFQPANLDDITYVVVTGYDPATAVDMSQPDVAAKDQAQKPILLPDYSESLFDWIARTLVTSAPQGGQP